MTSETLITSDPSHADTRTGPLLGAAIPSTNEVPEVTAVETASPVEAQISEASDEIVSPGRLTFVVLTVALMISIFMIGLDTNIICMSRLLDLLSLKFGSTILLPFGFSYCVDTILGTAIPKITIQFRSLNDVGWYGSAYLLTQLSLQPTFGKLYTFFNIKLVYISALLIFEVGSTICASASSSEVFIVGRAVAGAGSAGIWCGSHHRHIPSHTQV